jgi:hypothetical protein
MARIFARRKLKSSLKRQAEARHAARTGKTPEA